MDMGSTVVACVGAGVVPTLLPYLPEDLTKFLNVGSIGISFGTHIWVGSVAGLTMFRTLKRRTFGNVQSKLFPKYATMNTACSFVALATFLHLRKLSPTDAISVLGSTLEGGALMACLASNLLNSIYFIPATTNLMFLLHKRERELGLEDQVGSTSPLKSDPNATEEDKKTLMKFGIHHGVSMMMSLVSVVGCGAYLYYIGKSVSF
eukprot:sb/3470408/